MHLCILAQHSGIYTPVLVPGVPIAQTTEVIVVPNLCHKLRFEYITIANGKAWNSRHTAVYSHLKAIGTASF